jgi:SAM-dependent methyltransferase
VTGSYGQDSFPGQKFSLILFSHTVEHIPDPTPMLRSMKAHLEDDGVLFVATPNLLDPPMDRLTVGFLAGAHVRLYSPGALGALLAQCGFRVEKKADFHANFGMGMIAKPVDGITDLPHDDPVAILQLYGALLQPSSARTLGRNLASLTKHHWWILPILCRRLDASRYRLRADGHRVSAILGKGPAGSPVQILREDERDRLDGCGEDLPDRLGPDDATLVQLGLGWGSLALEVGRRLSGSQHFFIWETDPALAKLILKTVDLTPLWESTKVTLILGDRLHLPADQRCRMMQPSKLFVTGSARRWNAGLYRSFMDRVKTGEQQPAAVEAAAGNW